MKTKREKEKEMKNFIPPSPHFIFNWKATYNTIATPITPHPQNLFFIGFPHLFLYDLIDLLTLEYFSLFLVCVRIVQQYPIDRLQEQVVVLP